jgi:hypothetical protein
MDVKILHEAGFEQAMYGLSLNKNKNPEDMLRVAEKLAKMDGGHNKFLEHIYLWLSIKAPRYWWQEFDTYRIGVSKQSQSTMHTAMKRPLEECDFSGFVRQDVLRHLNNLIYRYKHEINKDEKLDIFMDFKDSLPEGFLQEREVVLNYKTLRNIIKQRHTHKLPQWQVFVEEIFTNCEHPEYLEGCA